MPIITMDATSKNGRGLCLRWCSSRA
jgi:hypothetical protein